MENFQFIFCGFKVIVMGRTVAKTGARQIVSQSFVDNWSGFEPTWMKFL